MVRTAHNKKATKLPDSPLSEAKRNEQLREESPSPNGKRDYIKRSPYAVSPLLETLAEEGVDESESAREPSGDYVAKTKETEIVPDNKPNNDEEDDGFIWDELEKGLAPGCGQALFDENNEGLTNYDDHRPLDKFSCQCGKNFDSVQRLLDHRGEPSADNVINDDGAQRLNLTNRLLKCEDLNNNNDVHATLKQESQVARSKPIAYSRRRAEKRLVASQKQTHQEGASETLEVEPAAEAMSNDWEDKIRESEEGNQPTAAVETNEDALDEEEVLSSGNTPIIRRRNALITALANGSNSESLAKSANAEGTPSRRPR